MSSNIFIVGKIMPTQRFRITPTSRGALFRAKRWFYSIFYTKDLPADVRENNKKIWVDMASRLVEEINKRNAADKPARLTINYESGPRGDFIPLSVTIELMEIKPVETLTIYLSKDEEKKKLKADFEEMIKRAKELGMSLEELKEMIK
ncbi:MAG: hypothetical protein QXR84_05675 [Candidatus Bathyarchaeia archaeon]|nr:hypothetical protein [Candidatus Bathyarchaeota archaeon]